MDYNEINYECELLQVYIRINPGLGLLISCPEDNAFGVVESIFVKWRRACSLSNCIVRLVIWIWERRGSR